MAKIHKSFFDMGAMDTLSSGDSPVHRVDPRAKLATTLIFIAVVVSFDKYEVSALMPFFLYPVALCSVGRLPLGFILKRMLPVAPFALLIGAFNPLLDRDILIRIGTVNISGGWVSYISIMLKFVLTAGAALSVLGITGFNTLCLALEKLGVPGVFVVQLMFLYRYLFVMVDEAARLVRAVSLRVFNRGGIGIRVFGAMVGQLLLRSLDRAQRIHMAMCCRGFDGQIRILKQLNFQMKDTAFLFGWSLFFITFRLNNIPRLMGKLVTEWIP